LRPHYARVDQEGRTLLHELFATAGDIHVADGELNLTLAPLSSPHRTRAAQALCELLDKTATIFPDLACAFASQCVPRGVSPSLSPTLQSSAAPPRKVPRRLDRRRNRTVLCYPMSGALKL